jgi:hypothetical protein
MTNKTKLEHIDPLVEVIVGLLIVRPDQRPSWVKTYDDAREYAETWAKHLRSPKQVKIGFTI